MRSNREELKKIAFDILLSFRQHKNFSVRLRVMETILPKLSGEVGSLPAFYYFILISHIILAAIIIPLALITLYRGWNDHIGKHRKIAKITLPVWLYVSITGVIIYYMLYW